MGEVSSRETFPLIASRFTFASRIPSASATLPFSSGAEESGREAVVSVGESVGSEGRGLIVSTGAGGRLRPVGRWALGVRRWALDREGRSPDMDSSGRNPVPTRLRGGAEPASEREAGAGERTVDGR